MFAIGTWRPSQNVLLLSAPIAKSEHRATAQIAALASRPTLLPLAPDAGAAATWAA
jgi:hypothetical protein